MPVSRKPVVEAPPVEPVNPWGVFVNVSVPELVVQLVGGWGAACGRQAGAVFGRMRVHACKHARVRAAAAAHASTAATPAAPM